MRPSDSLPEVCRSIIRAGGAAIARRAPRSLLERQAAALVAEALERLDIWTKDTRETTRREAYGAARACLALCDAPGAEQTGAREALQHTARAVVLAVESRTVEAMLSAHAAQNVASA